MTSFVSLIMRCAYCGKALTKYTRTVDHIQPLSRGGSDLEFNKVLSCRSCNQAKGSMTLVEWKAAISKKIELLHGQSIDKKSKYLNWLDHIEKVIKQCP